MTFLEAIESVKMYLHYDTADTAIQARLDVMIPRALNNARLWAERKHHWEMSKGSVYARANAASGYAVDTQRSFLLLSEIDPPVDDAGEPLTDTRQFYPMKSLLAVHEQNTDGTWTQYMLRLEGASQRLALQRRDLQIEMQDWPRTENFGQYDSPYFTVNGTAVYVKPERDAVLRLDGFLWMPTYISGFSDLTDAYEDFFLKYVPDVLIWKAVIDCNYITQTFVPRQDGNVGMPKDMLADAWDSAMDWDSYMHQQGINYQLG
jgi:hypothetical protein